MSLNANVINTRTHETIDSIVLGYSENVEAARQQYCTNMGYNLFEIKFEFID